jgi:hypothetical protein
VELGEGVAVAVVIAPAEAGDEVEFFPFGFFDGFENGADAGPINGDGLSQKMCFPAATAALRCMGRKPGGVVRITTSTPESSTFDRHRSRRIGFPLVTLTFSPLLAWSVEGAVDLVLKASPMAVRATFLSAFRPAGPPGPRRRADEADLEQIGAGGADGF